MRGTKPRELPVQLPVKVLLTLNLRTAKALGLNVPSSFLLHYQKAEIEKWWPIIKEAGSDPDSAPLIQKIGATSIAEIEKLIGELQETRNFLESEGQRIRAACCHSRRPNFLA